MIAIHINQNLTLKHKKLVKIFQSGSYLQENTPQQSYKALSSKDVEEFGPSLFLKPNEIPWEKLWVLE